MSSPSTLLTQGLGDWGSPAQLVTLGLFAATAGVVITPGTGTLALTGLAPTLVRTASQSVTPGTGVLTFTGYAPTLVRTAGQSVVPGVGTLSITGYAPTIAQLAGRHIIPGTGVLTFTGYAPTLVRTANRTVVPGTGVLSITGYAPTIGGSASPSYSKNGNLYLYIGSDLSIMLGGPRMPTWNTAGRPPAPALGAFGFNTTTGAMEVWDGSTWV